MQRNGVKLQEMMNGTMWDIPLFIDTAIKLAEMANTVHAGDSVIRDLNPAGIWVQTETGQALLAEQRKPEYAYLSPEQTGRMNRAPDERSDLYALGVMYYEMLAGRLPLLAESADSWVHRHLAIVPQPLHALRPELVGPLAEIVMKLLAKAPEERYQSAYGLLSDLRSCASSLQETGGIAAFEIARTDEISRFRLPPVLFGRDPEKAELLEALEQVRGGASAFVIVTGRAGIGKTALVRELQMPVTRQGGRFIWGKCELMNRDTPFSPILQALRGLIRQIWSESPELIMQWKARLAEALGQGAGIIAELLPEAAALLGSLPSVEPLPPAEAANRFRLLFPVFIHVFASREHPLVMVVDDLQWADPATLDVLLAITNDATCQGLLIIGTYRSEAAPGQAEIDDDQAAAALWMEQSLGLAQERAAFMVKHIVLGPLRYADVVRFTSFVLHEDTERVRLLAEPFYKKTGGNPLYMHRFMDSLFRRRTLYFDTGQVRWNWDAAAVKAMPDDPDVLHLIGARLRTLPQGTIGVLRTAGAIGHRFRPATIASVIQLSVPETLELLRPAVEEGFIWSETEGEDEALTGHEAAARGTYTFLHDQVQQAAYETVPPADKASLHLTIGRAMRSQTELMQPEDSIFDTVYHLNLGRIEMVDEAERRELAESNLQCGLKSKASTAFASALHFLNTGLLLLGSDSKENDPLAYRLMLELPECEYMCGRADLAESMLDQLLQCTAELLERSRIYRVWIEMNAYLKKDQAAVEVGRRALAEFGWKVPLKPTQTMMIGELIRTQWVLYRSRDELAHLPLNRTPFYKALSDLMMAVSTSAFISNPKLSTILYAGFVRYGLEQGNNEAFACMLGAYGLMLNHAFPRRNPGIGFIEIAVLLSSACESAMLNSRLHYIQGITVQFGNWQAAVEHFELSIRYGLESADLVFVCLSMMTRITTYIGDLPTLSARMTYYEEVSRQLLDETTINIFRIARRYVAELQGEADDRAEALPVLPVLSVLPVLPLEAKTINKTLNNEEFYTCTCQIEIAYLAGRYREALQWAERGSRVSFLQTRFQTRKQLVYYSFALAALYEEAAVEERRTIRALLAKQLRTMRNLTDCYGRESSAYLLIVAETRRMDGQPMAGIKQYEEAIVTARREGYRIMEAIACERTAVFYRAQGLLTAADSLLAEACSAYALWGAIAKVRELQKAYPEAAVSEAAAHRSAAVETGEQHLERKARQQQEEGISRAGGQGEAREGDSSWESVFSRDIDELVMRQAVLSPEAAAGRSLAESFLESAVRYAGAEKGYVLNSMNGVISVEAAIGAVGDTVLAMAESQFAESVVHYVVGSGDPFVLANALQGYETSDPYILRQLPKSILCMPIPYPGSPFSTVLYLENNLASGVFTKDRLAVLDMLFSRMVYLESLGNSKDNFNNMTMGAGELQVSSSPASPASLVSSPILESSKAPQPLIEPLTKRELDILRMLTDGLSNKEIADGLGLTEGTVKNHVFNLYGKLEVKRRAQAVARARELHLLD
jgi:predicted ATPase/DNA-binding CsgD family transcriptional regulator